MADFEPTPSQAAAMNVRNCSVLVSAGAGSGKTKVLTERLMRYVNDRESPVDIDRFVIITFTQAAASELRSRISDELLKIEAAAEKDSSVTEEFRRHIRRQQSLCRSAMIGTIHHFCASILRENGHLAGIASDFKIISDERADGMKNDILDSVISARYENMDRYPGFEMLLNSVGNGRDDSNLTKTAMDLYENMQAHARPDQWAEKCVGMIRTPEENIGATDWGRVILRRARETAAFWVSEMDKAMNEAQKDEKVKKAVFKSLEEGAESVRECERILRKEWPEARKCPLPVFPRPGSIRDKTDEQERLRKSISDKKRACKEAFEKIQKTFGPDDGTLLAGMKKTAPAMEALLALVLDFDKAYAQAKRQGGFLDYSDLEHITARLLTDDEGKQTPLAKSISVRYREIMVDEFQDVSHVQDTIFRAVSREENNLFMVGDVKQAIYGFRLADPGIFNEKRKSYIGYNENNPVSVPQKIMLRENFRSRREILACANSVFEVCMSEGFGDVDYDEEAALKYGATYYEDSVPAPELTIFAPPPDLEKTKLNKKIYEAQCVAKKIKDFVSSGAEITGKNGLRKVEYGDIAILLRNSNTSGAIYAKELSRIGVPVYSSKGEDYFKTREISCMMSLLSVMDTPHDDIALTALLSSPLFSFSADELAAIRAADGKCDFYSALKKQAENDKKCRDFLEKLDMLRRAVPDLTAEKLVRLAMAETDANLIFSAMPDGEKRSENLMHLIVIAKRFEADGYFGLHRFVQYLEKLQSKGTEASSGGNSENAVQIMSIHRSKGLEFPVVFLCGTNNPRNEAEIREYVVVHPELGIGAKYTDETLRATYKSLAYNAIAEKIKREKASEELRLLYVAMTRPKERLFMTGVHTDPEKFLEDAEAALSFDNRRINPAVMEGKKTYLDWLALAATADGFNHISLNVDYYIGDSGETEEKAGETAEADIPREFISEIKKRLGFRYPFTDEPLLPSKITATELKHRISQPDETAEELVKENHAKKHFFSMPEFTEKEKPLSPTEKGIATHLALQFMDIYCDKSLDGIRTEITRLEEKRFLTPRQSKAVDIRALQALFESELGKRIVCAEKLHREFRFSLLCPANEFLDTSSGEEILLQGVVDCCLEENGELVIIDYKTDSVHTEEQLRERTELYSGQVNAYTAALSRIFGMKVRETILYFLSCRKIAVIGADCVKALADV